MSLLDEKLVNETDIIGIAPKALGHFEIEVYKLKWETQQLSNYQYTKKIAAAEKASKLTSQLEEPSVNADRREQCLWDAQKVDEDTFKKDGIVYAIG